VLTSKFSVWSLELSGAFAWCNHVWLLCLASHSDAASAALRALFSQQDHAFVCVLCHQACLRTNAAAEALVARRDAGLLTNAAQHAFLDAMPQRPCKVAGWKEPSGVHRGSCSACYRRAPATAPKPRVMCASKIHDEVSTNKAPTAHPSPGIMPFLWSGAKVAEQAGLPRLDREKVCPACRTLAEKRNRSAAPSIGPLACPRPGAPRSGGPAAPQGADVPLSLARVEGPALTGSVAGEPALCASTGSPAVAATGPTGCGAGRAVDADGDCARVTAAATVASAYVASGAPTGSGAGLEARAAGPSVDLAIATVMAVCGSLGEAQRRSVDAIVSAHLVAEKPKVFRARSGNGRDILYTRETVPHKAIVGPRQARRRSLEASSAVARLCRDNEAAMEKILSDVCRRAQDAGMMAVVPSGASAALPVRLQTQFVVANSISSETWQRIRRFMGGSLSGLASAAEMRADGRAAFSEVRNRVTSTPVGATLVSVRAAVEALVADLLARNQFIERPVEGHPAGEILLSFGLDKGGRQSSCKAILACINQPHPCSRDNTILFGVFPCEKDDYRSLTAMAELFAPDLEDLRTNGITVAGVTRAVHLILMGDYSFTTSFDGHAGASCRFPCVCCCCLARPSAISKRLLPRYADYGTMQDGSRAARMPRTLLHKQEMAALFVDGPLATMVDPPPAASTLSYERRPLMVFSPEDIVPMPLHITLGVSPWMLSLGVEAVAVDAGAERAEAYAAALAGALRQDVGVSPAPYWGGTFEGKACHKIGRRLAAVCDVLEGFVPPARAAAYRQACELWTALLPVLNRAVIFGPDERSTFRRQAADFVDLLRSSFEWASITPKLHVLACHAADWLDKYGSLGLFSEQGLEAWHGYFNQNATVFAAGSFLESCVRLVERAAVSRGPGDLAFNRGKRRASAAADARCAKRPDDLRTARARIAAGRGTRQSAACAATSRANADKWASNVYRAAVCKIASYRAGPGLAGGAAAAASAAEAAAVAENQALLERAEAICLEALLEDWTN